MGEGFSVASHMEMIMARGRDEIDRFRRYLGLPLCFHLYLLDVISGRPPGIPDIPPDPPLSDTLSFVLVTVPVSVLELSVLPVPV